VKLRIAPSINKVDPALELEAEQLESDLLACRAKLAELLPTIQRIREYFAGNRGRAMLRGCKTWHEFCVRRLRVTPQAVHVCAKRLNLSTAQKEAAAGHRKEERRLRRWEADVERNQKELGRGTEFARARNKWLDQQMPDVPDVAGHEPLDEDNALDLGDDDRVVPQDALVRTLAALDEAVMTLDKIIGQGVLTIPALLATARKCSAHLASVAASIRAEFDIHSKAKVVCIKTHEQ
jgi:hypothetical protein